MCVCVCMCTSLTLPLTLPITLPITPPPPRQSTRGTGGVGQQYLRHSPPADAYYAAVYHREPGGLRACGSARLGQNSAGCYHWRGIHPDASIDALTRRHSQLHLYTLHITPHITLPPPTPHHPYRCWCRARSWRGWHTAASSTSSLRAETPVA